MNELSVVVVEDSVLIRDLLECAISNIEGCSLIGMAADGDEGINMINALKPQVVILDISMPRKNGIEVLREIRQENDEILIIMFTADPSAIYKGVCLEAGADYFLDKTELRELVDICKEQVKNPTTKDRKQLFIGQTGGDSRIRNYS